jgi:cell division protein FtsA
MAKKNTQSTLPHPLVAVELGSHGVRSMAVERTEQGWLHVLGAEASNRNTSVERGVVTNTSNAGYGIGECLKLLSNRIQHPQLTKAFVALGGRSMKVVEVDSRRNQMIRKEVPQYLLEEMDAECKQKIEERNPHVSVLALIPYAYVLDGVLQEHEPESHQRAAEVVVKYVAFVGAKELEQKVLDSFVRVPKHIEHTYARPDALLCALASDEDLMNGCAILDMGAQTTTLTVFKDNKYVYNKVVSQGGYDVTRDIEQLGISFAYAERLKCNYGSPLMDEGSANRCVRVPDPNAPEGVVLVRFGDVVNTIVARLNQILSPLMNDLQTYEDSIGVLYITGGASMLNGMEQYIQGLTAIPVMYGSHAAWLDENTPDEYYAPNYSSLIGTLILGAMYREKHPMAEPVDDLRKRIEKLTKNAQTSILDMFTEQY